MSSNADQTCPERTGASDPATGDLCPLQSIISSSPRVGRGEEGRTPLIVNLKRALKRHIGAKSDRKLKKLISAIREPFPRRGRKRAVQVTLEPHQHNRLEAGDLVRVRTEDEIEATLDGWRSLNGCAFLSEMASYCGTTQKVLKRVERFMDEKDYRMKKASGIVLLENVICPGTASTGRCDRACFFFWREEWLEKLEP